MTVSGPTISVVIAVRNGAVTLQRALDSVFDQTYEHVELLVVDGASTDATRSIIERNTARISWWVSKPDRGPYDAWNGALDHVTGEWICFLGADDRFHSPVTLERIASVLADAGGNYTVVYGKVRVMTDEGSIVRVLGDDWDRERFRAEMTTPHPAMFHHRSLFERNGRFDDSFRIAGDYEFLLRELLGKDPLFVPETIVDMGAGGLSDRPSTVALRTAEAHRARFRHGLEAMPEWRSPIVIRAKARQWLTRAFGRRAADGVGRLYHALVDWRAHRTRDPDEHPRA